MPTGGRYRGGQLGLATAVMLAIAGSVSGQDAGGLTADFTFAQGLQYSSDDGTVARTELGFRLASQTRSQNLGFDVNANLEIGDQNIDSISFVDPMARLSYGIESRQTAVATNFSYRRSDADSFIEDPDGDPGVLVVDEGTREVNTGDVDLTFGREAPIGGTVRFGVRELNYFDTTSPDLISAQTVTSGVSLRFDVDPRITLTLGYDFSETDRDGGQDTTTNRLTTGAQFAVSRTLDARVSVGVDRVTVTNGAMEREEVGLSYWLTLTQTRPLGTLQLSLESDLSEAGRRSTLLAGGTLETRRGNWTGEIGLSEGEQNKVNPVLRLTYGEDLPRGSFGVTVRQNFDTASDGDETMNSRLALNYRRDLTRTAQVSSNFAYQMSDVLGADDDTQRLEIGVSYRQALTEDWALRTRYTHSIVDQDGSARTRNDELFIGLETSIGWRP